jgi:hypothetical protein
VAADQKLIASLLATADLLAGFVGAIKAYHRAQAFRRMGLLQSGLHT